MRSIFSAALVNAVLTAAYVGLIGSFLFYLPHIRGTQTKTVFVPIALLLLLVFSAALVGALIFGRPCLWYLDGRRREACLLLAETLGILFVVIIVVFSTLLAVW